MKNHFCDQCDFRTSYLNCLRRHKNVKHIKIFLYKCAVCDKIYNRRDAAVYHIRIHQEECNPSDAVHVVERNDEMLSVPAKPNIVQTSKRFSTKLNASPVTNDVSMTEINAETITEVPVMIESMQSNASPVTNYVSITDIINEQTTEVPAMIESMQSNASAKIYDVPINYFVCGDCGSAFESKREWLLHNFRNHPKSTVSLSYRCDYCGKFLGSRDQKIKHMTTCGMAP